MNVSWLRKTEYISTEYNRFTQKADKSETKLALILLIKKSDLVALRYLLILQFEKIYNI